MAWPLDVQDAVEGSMAPGIAEARRRRDHLMGTPVSDKGSTFEARMKAADAELERFAEEMRRAENADIEKDTALSDRMRWFTPPIVPSPKRRSLADIPIVPRPTKKYDCTPKRSLFVGVTPQTFISFGVGRTFEVREGEIEVATDTDIRGVSVDRVVLKGTLVPLAGGVRIDITSGRGRVMAAGGLFPPPDPSRNADEATLTLLEQEAFGRLLDG